MSVQCSQCNGTFPPESPSCPYCGTVYYKGAEKAYMAEMEEIVEEVRTLAHQPKEELQAFTKSNTKPLLGGMFLLISLAVLSMVLGQEDPPESSQDPLSLQAQLIWEKEQFPKLDQWYLEGNYQALLDFMYQLQEDDTIGYTLSNWEHFFFLFTYVDYDFFLTVAEDYRMTGEIYPADLGRILSQALDHSLFPYFTEEEKKLIVPMIEEQYDFMLGFFTEEELAQIKESAMETGQFQYDICHQAVHDKEII